MYSLKKRMYTMQGNWVISCLNNEAGSSGVPTWRTLSRQQPDNSSSPFPPDGKYWLEMDFCSDVLAIKYKESTIKYVSGWLKTL